MLNYQVTAKEGSMKDLTRLPTWRLMCAQASPAQEKKKRILFTLTNWNISQKLNRPAMAIGNWWPQSIASCLDIFSSSRKASWNITPPPRLLIVIVCYYQVNLRRIRNMLLYVIIIFFFYNCHDHYVEVMINKLANRNLVRVKCCDSHFAT